MDFYHLLQTIHHIPGVDMLLGYADIQGDLLPINNDENFHKAVSAASPLLRIIITKKGKTRYNPEVNCVSHHQLFRESFDRNSKQRRHADVRAKSLWIWP